MRPKPQNWTRVPHHSWNLHVQHRVGPTKGGRIVEADVCRHCGVVRGANLTGVRHWENVEAFVNRDVNRSQRRTPKCVLMSSNERKEVNG